VCETEEESVTRGSTCYLGRGQLFRHKVNNKTVNLREIKEPLLLITRTLGDQVKTLTEFRFPLAQAGTQLVGLTSTKLSGVRPVIVCS
jgi:hypothetical protein